MFSNKKKGQILENKFAKYIMRFVFVFLSFFFVLQSKSFAETVQYKYIFDVGDGNKFVYTVDEETSYAVTNPNRFKIVNKELQGYSNSIVGYEGGDAMLDPIYMKDVLGVDLSVDSNKSIYNWCTYLNASTSSASSRKFMKSLLITFIDNGYDLMLSDSGNRDAEVYYLKPGIASQSANDAKPDDDYTYFWYYDTYWANTDYKAQFHSQSGGKTPFNRSYLSGNHVYLKDEKGETVSLKDKLLADKTMFSYINRSIEAGTPAGEYFKAMKVEVQKEPTEADQLVWWYREGSFNENEKSILVDCAKNVGDTPLFTFKYSATGELLEQPPYILKMNENNTVHELSIFEYMMNTGDGASGNSIYVYPDYTGGSKKTCKNKFKTGNKQKEQTGQFYLACNGVSFAQTGAQFIYVADFIPDNFRSISKSTGTAYGDKVCTIPASELNAIILELCGRLDDGLLFKYNNGYTFAYNPENGDIQFFKTDDPAEINYVGMNMNLKQMYAPFVDSSSKITYGISLKADPTGRSKRSFKIYSSRINGYDYQTRLNVLTTANGVVVYNEQGDKYAVDWSMSDRKKAMFWNLYNDASTDCMLSIRDTSGISTGYNGATENTTIPINSCPIIAEVSIFDWLEIEYEEEAEAASKHAKQVSETDSLTAALKSIEETRKEMVPFIEMLFKYARPVILFLVLISICLTAIYSILYHNDPEKRALVKLRLKNIAIGILVFSVSALIVALCIEYFTQASDMMFSEETDIDLNITNSYSMDKNWLLKIILNLIGSIADAVKWVIDFLATRMLRLDEREIDLATCIFGVENGGGVSLYPFEESEWLLYMWGYRTLSILAIAFIAVAILKNIVMVLLGAGDSEKMTLVRQDFLRIFVAILCIVIVPYCVRIMLTIVNEMVLLLPVSSSMFNLKFEDYNELEPVCNLVYYIIEIKVYLAFTVRKVMIAFLLIATPAVFGIWSISDKFRSFNLWLGEMLTNIFMQFTYGFAFFFLIMIVSSTKNPLVILMMLTMLMKLSDFIRDSLQGLFNQWGGINETGIANEAFNKVAGAPAKVWGVGKKVKNKVGNTMMNAANAYDRTKTNKNANMVFNAGAIITGNFGKIRSEKDRLTAIKDRADKGQGKKLRNKEARLRGSIEERLKYHDQNINKQYRKIYEGGLTDEEIKNLRESGGIAADIAEFAQTRKDIKEFDSKMSDIDKQIDDLGGLSTLRGSVSKDVLSNLKKESESGNNNVADIYEHTLDDFDKLEDQMNASLEKLADPKVSDEDKTKENATLKHVLEQVIDKAEIISEISIELNMTGGSERMEKIKNAQASAVREKANRFDKELKTEAMDSIETTQNNFDTLENRSKDAENAPKVVQRKNN